jgi:hypothetical protein
MRLAITVILLAAVATGAAAAEDQYPDEAFTYVCKERNKAHLLKLGQKMLLWKDRFYSVTSTEGDCQTNWRAESYGAPPFTFCTATKGAADIRYDNGRSIPCQLRFQ